MAGTLALVPFNPPVTSPSLYTIRERWEVEFSRFFVYPTAPTSTCPDLVPLTARIRNRRPRGGNWISAASSAMLQLIYDHSSADVILTVCCCGKIQEEHYVSKLLFSWPQVACMCGFPARGSRAVFASYTDSSGQIQKFGFRFLSVNQAEKFITLVKGILKEASDVQPLTIEYGSTISSRSEFMSSNIPLSRPSTDSVVVTPSHTHSPQTSPSLMKAYTPQTSPSFIKDNAPQMSSSWAPEAAQHGQTQHVSPSWIHEAVQLTPIQNSPGNFPPSFTSLLSNCRPVMERAPAQSTISKDVNLKALIARCMEGSSFQDILNQVETIIGELEVDLRL